MTLISSDNWRSTVTYVITNLYPFVIICIIKKKFNYFLIIYFNDYKLIADCVCIKS